MRIFNRLVNYLGLGLHGKCSESTISNIVFISLLSLAGSCLFVISGLVAFAVGELFNGIVAVLAAIFLVINVSPDEKNI
jgi:hypothetical protein